MSRKALWSVTILAACLLLAVGTVNVIRARKYSGRMACIYNLRQIDEAKKKWERERSETNFPTGGFLQMGSYIDRLLRSPKEDAIVLVCTTEGPHVIHLSRHAGRAVLNLGPEIPNRTWDRAEESRIRDFFLSRGMKPIREIRNANPLYDDAIYGLEFTLPGDLETTARLCVSVFADFYGVTDAHGLSVTTVGL